MARLKIVRQVAIVFAIVGTPALAAAESGKPYAKWQGDLWIAGNDGMEVAVSKSAGTLRRFIDRVSKEDYCNQTVRGAVPAREFTVGERIAGVTVFDELAGREFSDFAGNAKVTQAREENVDGSPSLSLRKTFPGAQFVVIETFTMKPDHLRWDVKVKKTAGADRTLRVVQFAPLPLGGYRGWAPISDEIPAKPYTPFAIEYGQSTSGSVGESRWRTNIPMMVYYSRANKRALSITCPFEVPAVRIRFLNNTGERADFHWNSRRYPPAERPYLLVSNEYLGLRSNRDVTTGLLLAAHPADWRPALGWVYSKYRKYFDPDPHFDAWDGALGLVRITPIDQQVDASLRLSAPFLQDSMTDQQRRAVLERRSRRGVRWENQHAHFPWYGLMIPSEDLKSWVSESHPFPGTTNTREKIRAHQRMDREFGIGAFIYYNCTEAEHWYAEEKFPESMGKGEDGKPIGAYMAEQYPGKRACWMMNSDPSTPFGKHMVQQARAMVDAYPDIAGFFWDVYGRSYMFDFAHDDGITMVNHKPAYFPGFMFERMMRVVGPLLHQQGKCIIANKPVTISSCEGLDGIMAIENTPEEETPAWIAAQSYLGLTRYVMILDNEAARHAELFFQNCLRYGMFNSDFSPNGGGRRGLSQEQVARNTAIARAYLPFIQRLRGKKWVFYPQALELPANTDGNIFRLPDGSVMITMASAWRVARNAPGYDVNQQVVCRLPDAAQLTHIYSAALDLNETAKMSPELSGDTLKIAVPKHGRTTVILLCARPDSELEARTAR